MYDKYETVIGLEVHVQLATKSKAFCGDSTSFGAEPNAHISAISLGHPGTLPRLNKQQLSYAIKLGLALDSKISLTNNFDRKNYFYLDLPKGYQITQDRMPVCIGGGIDIDVNGQSKHIRMHHIHMEEDAGKSIHDQDPENSLVDLNRAGVPLLEIVTEPDLRSAEEAHIFIAAIRQLVRYLGISDGNMEEGSMRCDCNVSVMLKGAEQYGERCEIKNVNSLKFAKKSIEYEIKRQIELIESGGKVRQQTLKFDPVGGRTFPLRDKEDAHDYRYFPEPDLPPIVVNETSIQEIRASLPELPASLKKRFQEEFKLSKQNAIILTEEKESADYFLGFCKHVKNPVEAANLCTNKVLPFCNENKIKVIDFPVGYEQLAKFLDLIADGKVSSSIAYQRLFPSLIEQPTVDPFALAEQLNLIQTEDEGFLEKLVDDAIAKFPDKAAAYKKGKKNLIGLFMGEVMRNSQGKANPKKTTEMLKKKLG